MADYNVSMNLEVDTWNGVESLSTITLTLETVDGYNGFMAIMTVDRKRLLVDTRKLSRFLKGYLAAVGEDV